MAEHKLDHVDVRILEILQEKARTKRSQLAEVVKLSIPTVSERLHKLERNGYIKSYKTVLDPHKLQLSLTAFIFLSVENSGFYPGIVERAADKKQILECHAITGAGSHLLKVRVRNTRDLEKLLSEIQSWPGVKYTRTDVVLSTPKETTAVDLDHLK